MHGAGDAIQRGTGAWGPARRAGALRCGGATLGGWRAAAAEWCSACLDSECVKQTSVTETQALSCLSCGCEMDTVTSLLKWVSVWVGSLAPSSEEEKRARLRLALKEEQAKPAGQRSEKRLLALLVEDKKLTFRYCRVCWRARL